MQEIIDWAANPFLDPVFEIQQNYNLFVQIVREIFGESTRVMPTNGVKNALYDCTLHDVFSSKSSLTCEVKMRAQAYPDVCVEILQHQDKVDKFKEYVKWEDFDCALNFCRSTQNGWLWHTKAQIIIVINPECIQILKTKRLRDYVSKNLFNLESKYCRATTGSLSKVVPINNETKDFITIKQSKLIKQMQFRSRPCN